MLALADGTVFHGTSIGAPGRTVGEVVFNTALTGYQEILTDPSYAQQIVTLTYPHIGNYGVSAEDVESRKVFAAGLVIKDLPLRVSNFRSAMTLPFHRRRGPQGSMPRPAAERRPHRRDLPGRGHPARPRVHERRF